MKAQAAVFVLIFAFTLACLQLQAISLQEAISQKKVQVSFENNGHYKGASTQVIVQNLSKNALMLNSSAGIVVQSEDSSSQQLVISEPLVATIQPGKSWTKLLHTFCITSYKGGPQSKEKYTYLKEADTYLFRLVGFINAQQPDIDDSQSAVWACMNGRKDVFVKNRNASVGAALQKLVRAIYEEKLAQGLIAKDTTELGIAYENFQLQGSYDLFVKNDAEYSAFLEDSTGARLYAFIDKRLCSTGLYPIRYMHAYAAAREKPFYISIYKNGALVEKTKAVNDVSPRGYERIRYKSSVVFNIKDEFFANLNLVDSLGRVYVSYFTGKKMYHGIIPFDYSFTIAKPRHTTLFMELTDAAGKVYFRQKIDHTKTLMALRGYFYVRVPKSTEAIFGLFGADGQLLEEFENKRYDKGLQMLPYGFMFDKTAKEDIFLKLKDKQTGQDIQSEKVFVK